MKLSTVQQPSRRVKKRTQVCSTCIRKLPLSCFYLRRYAGRGKRRGQCKSCIRKYRRARHDIIYAGVKKRREKVYLLVYRFLARHPCVDCGEKNFQVLEFDHIDPENKNVVGGVAQLLCRNASLKRIKTEIEKCEVVCANCHKIRTAEQTNSLRYQLYQQINEEIHG